LGQHITDPAAAARFPHGPIGVSLPPAEDVEDAPTAGIDAAHLAYREGSMHCTFGTLTAVLLSSLACASNGTSLTSTWRAPEFHRLPFHRALTSFVSTDVGMRRAVEDRLATRIPGTFPAYSAVPELSLSDPAKAREQLRGKLFDGAVVVRIVEARTERASPPDAVWYTANPSFYGYWGSSWMTVRNPASGLTEKPVLVEVVIYSLADDRLVWAGRTETMNPKSVKELVDHSVDAVVRELWSKRMIR
jgi:hypothetical protein